MNLRKLQGWAWVLSGLALIFLLILKYSSWTNGMRYALEILSLVSSVGLIFGLPGIQAAQPQTKHWGIIGLILMSIPSLQELITTLIFLFGKDSMALIQSVSSAWNILAAVGFVYLGYIMVGWLTIQARVFPAWVGWLLLIVGVMYGFMWLIVSHKLYDAIPFPPSLNFAVMLGLLEVVTRLGYGINIMRYRVPRKKRAQHRVQQTGGYAPPK